MGEHSMCEKQSRRRQPVVARRVGGAGPACGGMRDTPGNRHSAWAGKLFVVLSLFKHPKGGVKRVRPVGSR